MWTKIQTPDNLAIIVLRIIGTWAILMNPLSLCHSALALLSWSLLPHPPNTDYTLSHHLFAIWSLQWWSSSDLHPFSLFPHWFVLLFCIRIFNQRYIWPGLQLPWPQVRVTSDPLREWRETDLLTLPPKHKAEDILSAAGPLYYVLQYKSQNFLMISSENIQWLSTLVV